MRAVEYASRLSEAEFQEKVITLARARGWMVHHDRPARTIDGARWMTHVQGDVGFPDLVLARRGQVIFAELKSEAGRVTNQQQAWLDALDAVVWRPSDWRTIQETLL